MAVLVNLPHPRGFSVDRTGLGVRLRLAREGVGLTQAEAAEHLGITRSGYTYYETGRSDVSATDLGKLADLFGVSTDYLLGRVDQELNQLDVLLAHNARDLTPQQKENLLALIRSMKQ